MELKHNEYLRAMFDEMAFNRTLWNWNKGMSFGENSPLFLLIVPYGIETIQ